MLNKFEESSVYLYRALALSFDIKAMNYVKNCYEELSVLYEKSNIPLQDSVGGILLNMEQMRIRALYYNKRYYAIRDTLFGKARQKQIMNLDFAKKEALAKAEHDREIAVAEEKNRRHQTISWSIAAGLLLVIIFSIFVVRSLKTTREQKRIIEKKQKDILDSIRYAKRIQSSLLPTEKYIDKILDKNKP
jgi:hypothetical protein